MPPARPGLSAGPTSSPLPPGLAGLMAAGEGQRVEFKRGLPRPRRLARLLAGMANAGGGVVLFGVDDRGRAVGVEDPEAVEQEIRLVAAGHLEPVPLLAGEVFPVGEAAVLAVAVEPPAEGVVAEIWGSGGQEVVRVNDHVQPVARLPESAAIRGLSRQKRLEKVPAQTRQRYLTVAGSGLQAGLGRFHMAEYAQACNVSARTARRDIVLLSRVFLICEVEKGLYEIIRA